MDLGAAIIIAIAGIGLLVALFVQVKDYLVRRDDRTEWRAGVDTDRRDLKAFMTEIRAELSRIHSRIDDIFGKLGGPATVKTASPITLTDLGRSISETLEASAWAADRAEELSDRIANSPAYDIQELAFQYVERYVPDNALEEKIKQCAYENGLRRKQVLDVLAMELRARPLRLRQLDLPDD